MERMRNRTVIASIPAFEMDGVETLHSNFGRTLLSTAAWVAPLMAALIALVSWHSLAQDQLPLSTVGASAVGAGLFAILIIWVLTLTTANYGIQLSDDGVSVFTPKFVPGRRSRRTLQWSEMGKPSVNPVGTDVVFETDGFPLTVSAPQARAILMDPRCPARGRVPADVATRIQLNA
jgi:hypothetical protein